MTSKPGQVEVHGTPIRFWESGSGGVVVILDDGLWGIAALVEPLAARCRVLRLDLTGFADMPAEAAPKSAEDLARLTGEAVGEITADNYTLIGASLAATAALRHTLLAPDNVEALVLLSPVAVLPTGDPTFAADEELVAHPKNASRLPAPEIAATESRRTMLQTLSGGPADSELAVRLEEIACATLAVFGVNDRMVSPEAARVYRERIPNSNISLIYDAGHAILADRPEAVINAVADFVERRETFIVGRESGVINP